jgi:hypothetical protein
MLFTSIDKEQHIEIDIIEDTAYFKIITMNSPIKKYIFFHLLKKIMDYLVSQNVKYVKMEINEEDSVLFKNSSIIRQYSTVIVKTNIEVFTSEIGNIFFDIDNW